MQATFAPSIPTNAGGAPMGGLVQSPPLRLGAPRETRNRNRTGGFSRLSPVLNVAMAALLVVVLGFSAWSLMGTRLGGSGDGPGGTEAPAVASLAAQDVPATPIAQSVLPTADECTIQPLTIDQVMERIKGPFSGNADNVAVVEASPISYGTPPLIYKAVPAQEDLDAIAKVQREFVACTIKGDLLQVWAFYAPGSAFWRDFLDHYPVFTDETTVRSDIEAFLAGEPNIFLPGLGWDGVRSLDGKWIPYSLPVVNPNPQESLVGMDQMTSQGRIANVNVAMLYYDPGDLEAAPLTIPRGEMASVWAYEWSEATQTWMISQIGQDANRG